MTYAPAPVTPAEARVPRHPEKLPADLSGVTADAILAGELDAVGSRPGAALLDLALHGSLVQREAVRARWVMRRLWSGLDEYFRFEDAARADRTTAAPRAQRPPTPALTAWRRRTARGRVAFDALWDAACWEDGAVQAWKNGDHEHVAWCLARAHHAIGRRHAG